MRLIAIVALMLLLAPAYGIGAIQVIDGNRLKSLCAGDASFGSGYCVGFVAGVFQSALGSTWRVVPPEINCPENSRPMLDPPGGIHIEQVVEIVRKYLESNEMLFYPADILVDLALTRAFGVSCVPNE